MVACPAAAASRAVVASAAGSEAVRSLSSHAAYVEHVEDHPDPATFIPQTLHDGGSVAGCEHAVTFRVYDLGWIGSTES